MALKIALKVHDDDNVATLFANDIDTGNQIEVRDRRGDTELIQVKDPIPFGHKVAVTDIPVNVTIKKYGEEIGIATKSIYKGEHVHVHNLDSMRGRGDL